MNLSRPFFLRLFIVLAVLALGAALIYFTGWGVVPGYKGDWSRGIPAVALLEWQIALAVALCAALALLEKKRPLAASFDRWLFLAVWLFAAAVWLSQPINPNSGALEPHEPNFEIYPFSDSQIYDGYAQSALVGNGYGENVIPQRPLYIAALTLMRFLAGQSYQNVIILQTLLFAFFPALLYLFGKDFFGRPIGAAIALLAILRDVTSNIAAPFTGNLSYSKLLLSEIPTAIFLILALWLGTKWIRAGFPRYAAFLTGGALGVGMLIRTQVIAALPVLLLAAILSQPQAWKRILQSAALMSLAIALVTFPWLLRNHSVSGEWIFDQPASQVANLALRYSRVNGDKADIFQHADETNAAYNARLTKTAQDALMKNPLGIGKEILSAFLNHNINNILVFPLRYDLARRELLIPARAFWQQWHGDLNAPQTLLLTFYVFLYGLGIAFAWNRLGALGLLPLGVNLAYNLWTSIALLSGQRFMLTMDWSAYLYYMLGFFALMSAAFKLQLPQAGVSASQTFDDVMLSAFATLSVNSAKRLNLKHYIITGACFLLIGASLWGIESAFPKRYPLVSDSQALAGFPCLQKLAQENGLNILQARALYPRYYQAGDGETFTDAAGYKRVKYNRVVFETVGEWNARVVLPLKEEAAYFPHAADVTLGLQGSQTWFVIVEKDARQKMYLADFVSACR
ncbi:MAG: hypothetical protein Fur002_03050 [Anaerolineales bacterium]